LEGLTFFPKIGSALPDVSPRQQGIAKQRFSLANVTDITEKSLRFRHRWLVRIVIVLGGI
jgi:hypothetical protein